MGDALQIVVDTDAGEAEAEAIGERAIAWLAERKLVGPVAMVQRGVGDPFAGPAREARAQKVWPPGERALSAVAPQKKNVFDFRKRDPNHVELRLGRAVYAQEGARCTCPACHRELKSYWDLVGVWVENGKDAVRCPLCRRSVPVRDLRFEPSGAAGALAIVFWNWWPLKATIIEELSKELDHRLALVWDFL